MKVTRYVKGLALAVTAVAGMTVTSCEDEPDKYEIADGVPTLRYVRMTDPAVSDSLVTAAYLSNTVCLVGDNLRSIYELYFNDQKAVLNTSVMTDNTVIVDIPSTIPTEVTNKIYMVTKDGQTVDYDFNVLVPAPETTSMTCEYAAPGTEVSISGNYYIDDENVPLSITIGEVPVTEITSVTQNEVKFVIPQNVSTVEPSYINVTSIYGTGRSTFRYREDTGILFDFDNDGDAAREYGDGWSWGNGQVGLVGGVYGIDNNYLTMSGELGDSKWNDDFCFQYYPFSEGNPNLNDAAMSPYLSEIKSADDLDDLQLKFEINVPEAWSAGAMQIVLVPHGMFSGDYNHGLFDSSVIPNNTEYPRALWRPWRGSDGGYSTDGWVTVTVPLSDFRYSVGGTSVSPLSDTNIAGLVVFVYDGGVSGIDLLGGRQDGIKCTPTICIDNIRVVPIN